MKRPSYREAVAMLLDSDQSWTQEDGDPSIEAALVRDLFGVSTHKLRVDVLRAQKRFADAA